MSVPAVTENEAFWKTWSRVGSVWVVRVEGDNGELRHWQYIYVNLVGLALQQISSVQPRVGARLQLLAGMLVGGQTGCDGEGRVLEDVESRWEPGEHAEGEGRA